MKHFKVLNLILAGTMTSVLVAACDQPNTTGPDGMEGARMESEAPDGDFLVKAAEGGMLEVEMGKLAASKATSPEVRAFAQQMVTDHAEKNSQLMALAAPNNVSLPSAPTEKQVDMINELQQKTGPAFDQAYMDHMIDAHEDMLDLFEDAAESAANPEVRTLAERTVPNLQQHLEMARSVDKQAKERS